MTSNVQFTVRTIGETMARSVTDAGVFRIFMDEPQSLGGQNGAPSPLDYLLAAHGGCLNYMAFLIAHEMGIPLTATEITITAALNPGGFSGEDRTVRAGYQSIHADIKLKSTATSADIDLLRTAIEQRCPVSDNISNATPVSITATIS